MEDDTRLTLRLPGGLALALARRSAENMRSLNAEICWILQEAFPVGALCGLVRSDEGVESTDNRDQIAESIAASPLRSAMERDHDVKRCRVYRCGRCENLGVKDAKRGLE
jgi:hypothetical protein